MTAQRSDVIYVNGKRHILHSCPLEQYWTDENPKPEIGIPPTSCYSGYVATWEIVKNYLYLIEMIFYTPRGEAGLEYIFPYATGKIRATWYSGELRIPLGDRLIGVQDYNESVYESDWFISINKGEVKGQRYKANY